MAALGFRYVRGGLHFPRLGLWLDAHERIGADELALVTHAHGDHTAAHARVLATRATRRFMETRIGGRREWIEAAFGERRDGGSLGLRERDAAVTLLPAGHILGSAMALVEAGGESLLYTGDFKLRPSRAAERCEPVRADVLVMETTFGLPRYVFPPSEDVAAGMVRFCREALDNDEVPVLLGYSLGKAQEILAVLGDAGLPAMLADPVRKMTLVYEELGMRFGAHSALDPASVRGHVVVAPPTGNPAAPSARLRATRTAMMTGWAMDPGGRRMRGMDAMFPLSDHAGFDDLVEFVARVRPRRVFTLHGFASEFASHLRSLGYEASALSEPDQLELALGTAGARSTVVPVARVPSAGRPAATGSVLASAAATESFAAFAAACAGIRAEPDKDRKAALLGRYLDGLDAAGRERVGNWLADRPAGIGAAAIRDAVCGALGVPVSEFARVDLRHADAAETAAELSGEHGATVATLALDEVAAALETVARGAAAGTRRRLLEALWRRATGVESVALARVAAGRLRLGLDRERLELILTERGIRVRVGMETKNVPGNGAFARGDLPLG